MRIYREHITENIIKSELIQNTYMKDNNNVSFLLINVNIYKVMNVEIKIFTVYA